MPDWLKPDALLVFLAFFVPGFISLQVYGLFVSIDDSDIQKRLPVVTAFSAIHYAVTGWIILIAPPGLWKTVATYLVVLVLPIFWGPLILLIRDYRRWKPRILSKKVISYMLAPEASPWDRVFGDKKAQWIRVRLKNGIRYGGFFGNDSASSNWPCPEQLFISSEFAIDQQTGEFKDEVPNTGLLINGSEISVIELTELTE